MRWFVPFRRLLPWLFAFPFVWAGAAHGLTLEEAAARALATNPEVRAAEESFRAAEKEVEQAKAGYWPSLDLTASYGREASNNSTTRAANGSGRTLNRRDQGLSLNQMLFDGFSTSSAVARAVAGREAARWQHHEVAERLTMESVEVYMETLRRQTLVALKEEHILLQTGVLAKIEKLRQRRYGTVADVRHAESRLALQEADLESHREALSRAKDRFIRIIGIAPNKLTTPLQPRGKKPQSKAAMIKLAQTRHPTMRSAQYTLESALADKQAARAGFYPNVNLALTADKNNNVSGIEGLNRNAAAMVRVSYNLFRGGSDRAGVQRAIRIEERARAELEQTQRTVTEAASAAWEALSRSRKRVGLLESHLRTIEQVIAAYMKQFIHDDRSFLDLLNSNNEKFQAEANLEEAKSEHATNHYRIFNSMGVLRDSLTVSATEIDRQVVSPPPPLTVKAKARPPLTAKSVQSVFPQSDKKHPLISIQAPPDRPVILDSDLIPNLQISTRLHRYNSQGGSHPNPIIENGDIPPGNNPLRLQQIANFTQVRHFEPDPEMW